MLVRVSRNDCSGDQILAADQGRWSLRWALSLVHFPGPSGSVSRAPQGHCPRWALSLLGSWPQAVTLLANGNCPGSWEDMVKDWQPAHSLAGDADSGVDCSSPLPSTSGCHTCLSGSMAGGHKRQQAYFPLVFNMV